MAIMATSRSTTEEAIRNLCLSEYGSQRHKPNERAVEYSFVFKSLNEVMPETVLDVGTGRTALPSLINTAGYMVSAIDADVGFNRHWLIIKDDITNIRTIRFRKFDFISCISVLEHIPEHEKAFDGMLDLLSKDGYICLTVPWNPDEFIDNIYDNAECNVLRNKGDLCHVFSNADLDKWLLKCRLIDYEFWKIWGGKYWGYGYRRQPVEGKITDSHLACLLLQCR